MTLSMSCPEGALADTSSMRLRSRESLQPKNRPPFVSNGRCGSCKPPSADRLGNRHYRTFLRSTQRGGPTRRNADLHIQDCSHACSAGKLSPQARPADDTCVADTADEPAARVSSALRGRPICAATADGGDRTAALEPNGLHHTVNPCHGSRCPHNLVSGGRCPRNRPTGSRCQHSKDRDRPTTSDFSLDADRASVAFPLQSGCHPSPCAWGLR